MKWLLRLRDILEGSHTPSLEERWRMSTQRLYSGQRCPCGEPATSVYQLQVDDESGTYYRCSVHVAVVLWIPNPDDTGEWF